MATPALGITLPIDGVTWGWGANINQGLSLIDSAFLAEVGMVAFFGRGTPPPGWLALNGSVVGTVAYANLVAACYVGNVANPTAPAFYKCTNPAAPTTSRSTVGTYMVLPDARGEFLRAVDSGRGVDAGRVLGSWQSFQLEMHNHAIDAYHLGTAGTTIAVATSTALGGTPTAWFGARVGGNETRPRNIALLACIKF